MEERISYTGKRFGNLLVGERAYGAKTANKVMYHCTCDCGADEVVNKTTLARGAKRSCQECAKANKQRNDIAKWEIVKVGDVFGHLTVLAKKNGFAYCDCDCGMDYKTTLSSLVDGTRTMCLDCRQEIKNYNRNRKPQWIKLKNGNYQCELCGIERVFDSEKKSEKELCKCMKANGANYIKELPPEEVARKEKMWADYYASIPKDVEPAIERYEELANAVVLLAIQDMENAMFKYVVNRNFKYQNDKLYRDAIHFIKSETFDVYCSLGADRVLRQMKVNLEIVKRNFEQMTDIRAKESFGMDDFLELIAILDKMDYTSGRHFLRKYFLGQANHKVLAKLTGLPVKKIAKMVAEKEQFYRNRNYANESEAEDERYYSDEWSDC